jgi:hypothetical protein
MKRVLFALAATLVLSSTLIASANAAPKVFQSKTDALFEGTFSGFVRGDEDSQAPMKIEINQDGNDISGTLELGHGLYIDGGRCGSGYIPSTVQSAVGEVNNRQIETTTAIRVAGIKVTIDLEGRLSGDEKTLEAEAKVDLPWICGQDPVISTILVKEL